MATAGRASCGVGATSPQTAKVVNRRRLGARMEQSARQWPAGSLRLKLRPGARRGPRLRGAAPESPGAATTGEAGRDEGATAAGLSDSQGVDRSAGTTRGGESWGGYAQLMTVSVLWGTYDPTMKMLYAEDRPLDPSTLTAIRTVLMAVALLGLAVGQRKPSADGGSRAAAEASGPIFVDGAAVLWSSDRRGLLAYSFAGILPAGVELGLYHFGSVATQALGLQLSSATRACFLVQLTALLVPVISYLGGVRISSRTWMAVGLGVAGSLVVAYDSLSVSTGGSGSNGGADEIHGMALIIASCIFNGLLTIRLGTYASRFESVDLAAIKMLTLGTASVVWFLGGVHTSGSQSLEPALSWAGQLDALGLTGRPAESYALVLYSALGPGAVGNLLQAVGQSSVPPITAQVIYSLKSVWGAVLAQLLLGSEGTGPLSWAGGATVLGASLLSAAAQAEEANNRSLDK